MEAWQKDIINNNITELVENTECNVLLLSRLEQDQILDRGDVQQINACTTGFEKARCFYDKIVKKDKSFETLVKALEKTRQTGASEILKRNNVARPPAYD
ncbi:unnamed protein product [Orchesella dallaii]|uniref:CARD domain-containing protein n=1 Tax=Orchesella dallaii TaxID=48710 RepID=A0ABP1PM87_9HEXA